MKVALARILPPVGPFRFPIDCSKRQGIAPVFGQLAASEPAAIDPVLTAHTRLLSNELCHVALPPEGQRVWGEVVGVCIRAEEVRDDLDGLPEDICKEPL
jgi:hypothetical protein